MAKPKGWPVDRKYECTSITQKLTFSPLVDLTDELDPRRTEKRLDVGLEIGLIYAIDFGRDFERQSDSARDLDGAVYALFRRDTTEERKIATTGVEGRGKQISGQPVIYRAGEIGTWDRPALCIRDGDEWHLGKGA